MARVLMITQDSEVDRRILQEARSLVTAGYCVRVLARAQGVEDAQGVVDGVDVEWVAVRGRDPRFGWLYRTVGVGWASRIAALWSVLTRSHTFTRRGLPRAVAAGADVFHAHDLNTLELAHRAARSCGAKLVYDAHELFPEIRNPWIRLRRRAWSRLESRLLPSVDLAITVNELLAAELARRYDVPPPLVLLNAVETPPDFDPQASRGLLHERLALDPSRKIVLYQGWFARGRGLEMLVRSARYLVPEAALVLLGYGSYQRRLERIAGRLHSDRVYFLPAVPQRALLRYCATADVAVIPYQDVDLNHRYASPNKLFDFIQAQVPIVVNDLPYLRHVVDGEGLGVVARLDTPRDCAAAINSLLSLPDGGAGLRANLRRAAPRYTWGAEAPKLIGAYARLGLG